MSTLSVGFRLLGNVVIVYIALHQCMACMFVHTEHHITEIMSMVNEACGSGGIYICVCCVHRLSNCNSTKVYV